MAKSKDKVVLSTQFANRKPIEAIKSFGFRLINILSLPGRGNFVISPVGVASSLLLAGSGARLGTRLSYENLLGMAWVSSRSNYLANGNSYRNIFDEAGRIIDLQNFVLSSDLKFGSIESTIRARVVRRRQTSTASTSSDTSHPFESVENSTTFDTIWRYRFAKKLMEKREFHQEGVNRSTLVDMLTQSGLFRYAKSTHGEMVEIPTKWGSVAFRILLPASEQDSNSMVKAYIDLSSRLRDEIGTVVIPRLRINSRLDAVKELSIESALNHGSDYSGISPEFHLRGISAKAEITVSEKGVKPAQVLVTHFAKIGPFRTGPDFMFVAERPFYVFVSKRIDNEELILVVARVARATAIW